MLAIAVIAMLVASGTVPNAARAAGTPTLRILSPPSGAVIGNGTPVAVIFAVTDFNLTDPGTGGSGPNSGHVAVLVDGTPTASVSVNTVVLPLPSGSHTILLRLVNDTGSALSPDVTASVSVMVTQGPSSGMPGVSVAYPAAGAFVGTDFWVGFRVSDFVLVPMGSPPGVPGEGHVHVLLDGDFYTDFTTDEPVHFNLPDGTYTVTFQLVDSGSHPLNPDVSASVTFNVKALTGRIIRLDLTPYLAGANVILGLAILAAIYRKLEV